MILKNSIAGIMVNRKYSLPSGLYPWHEGSRRDSRNCCPKRIDENIMIRTRGGGISSPISSGLYQQKKASRLLN